MIGQMGSFDRPSADLGDVLDLYLHGYGYLATTYFPSRSPGGLPCPALPFTVPDPGVTRAV